MKIKEISNNVLLLSFPDKKSLTFSMCRVEEYYEASNERLRGKIFTWAQFIDEFLNNKGEIEYFHKWSGFNVPGNIFLDWNNSFLDKSLQEQRMATAVLEKIKNPFDKFYVIAAQESATDIEDHEIAHALFYVSDNYKTEMMQLNSTLDLYIRNTMINEFRKLGYADIVHEDELQAYFATSDNQFLNERFGLLDDLCNVVVPLYKSVFTKYTKQL